MEILQLVLRLSQVQAETRHLEAQLPTISRLEKPGLYQQLATLTEEEGHLQEQLRQIAHTKLEALQKFQSRITYQISVISEFLKSENPSLEDSKQLAECFAEEITAIPEIAVTMTADLQKPADILLPAAALPTQNVASEHDRPPATPVRAYPRANGPVLYPVLPPRPEIPLPGYDPVSRLSDPLNLKPLRPPVSPAARKPAPTPAKVTSTPTNSPAKVSTPVPSHVDASRQGVPQSVESAPTGVEASPSPETAAPAYPPQSQEEAPPVVTSVSEASPVEQALEPDVRPTPSAARMAQMTNTCERLMMARSKTAIARGWVLATWLEQSSIPYPPSLPRPLEIEAASQVLPRLCTGKNAVATDTLTNILTLATEAASGSRYEMSPCQAHIRLALGLPLLLFTGMEPAQGWVMTAQDQEESKELRHWAAQAVSYWQKTHLPLKDAGVLQDVKGQHRRASLATQINDHYETVMNATISYLAAAKVKAKFFPRNGQGGLRWVLSAINSEDVKRLRQWASTFDPSSEIDNSARTINHFRDKIDYSARTRLIEQLSNLKDYVMEWCSTFNLEEGGRRLAVNPFGNQFAVNWREKANDYREAILALPNDQVVARDWLLCTHDYFHEQLQQIGGVKHE